MLKMTKDADGCWSVWASGCNCCDDGWHWMVTTTGEDAEQSAQEWMEMLQRELGS